MDASKEAKLKAWGVDPGFKDDEGNPQSSPEEAIDVILEILGADGPAPPGAPVKVMRQDEPLKLEPGDTLMLEDGAELRDTPSESELPLGYHRVVGEDGSEIRLIVSPGACFLPESLSIWGWALQLYATRSERSWGIGDLGDLAMFGRWASEQGSEMALVSPLHAAAPSLPQESSPYFPASRCYRNLLHLALEDVPGFAELPDRDELILEGRALNATRTIDRDAAYRLKLGALESCWAAFRGAPEFDAYVSEQGAALEGFATYMTLAETYGAPWREWPSDLRRADGPAVERCREERRGRVSFHSWVQWLLDRQLKAASSELGMVHDLAIGVDPAGADAWQWQDEFATGTSVGAPPDGYNTEGQDWGVLGFDPWALRRAGYEPFIQTLRASMRHAAGMRFDHVMGLFRLFWIPDGADARSGAYVRYPARELLDILALESRRAEAYVIGEDLGTVEPVVREEMAARSMLSYRLMWFEEDPPSDFPELSLAAATSHDLPTTAGLWTGTDLDYQKSKGFPVAEEFTQSLIGRLIKHTGVERGAPVGEVVARTYEEIARSASVIATSTLEDALEVEERHNYPGTSGPWNWSTALPATLEEAFADPRVQGLATAMNAERSQKVAR